MKWHIDPTKIFLHNILVCRKNENSEQYYLNGKFHNPNGPAYRSWYENGQLYLEEYHLNDQRHNPNGPACRGWYDNGKLWREEYRLNGKLLTKDQFLAKLNK